MTGTKNFNEDGNTLKMTLAGNKSKANRLSVTLNAMDTYDTSFWRYVPPKFNANKLSFKDEVIAEVANVEGVCSDQLQSVFTQATGLYTRL